MSKKNISSIAEVYAKALFNVSQETKIDTKVIQDFLNLFAEQDTKDMWILCIKNPTFNQTSLMDSLLNLVEKDFSSAKDALKNLISILISNKRLEMLPNMADKFRKYINLQQQVLNISVHTSKDSGIKKDFVLAQLKVDENKANVDICEDNKLMGGVKVEIDSNVYDYSNKAKINKLSNLLKNITY